MILLDTNILSTFAIIDKLHLLSKIFTHNKLAVSENVFSEVNEAEKLGYSHASAILQWINKEKINVYKLTEREIEYAMKLPISFGQGEKDSLALVKSRAGTFLTNETRVVNFCKREEIICFNLRMILKKLWSEGIVTKEEVGRMIVEIEDKDNVTILNKEEILS